MEIDDFAVVAEWAPGSSNVYLLPAPRAGPNATKTHPADVAAQFCCYREMRRSALDGPSRRIIGR